MTSKALDFYTTDDIAEEENKLNLSIITEGLATENKKAHITNTTPTQENNTHDSPKEEEEDDSKDENETNVLSPVQVQGVYIPNNTQFSYLPLPSPIKVLPPPAIHNARQIELRNPYPLPPPASRPRSPNTIIQEHLKLLSPVNMKYLNPSEQLKELLKAARGTSVARRCNACGALKVLAARKENQKKLARTKGVLDSLVYAANQTPASNHSDNAFDARTRAVATILYLSTPVTNRTLILTYDGLANCLVKVMREDYGEARVNACSALAILAKTPENRGFMMKVTHLPEIVAEVVSGKRKYVLGNQGQQKQRQTNQNSLSEDDSSVGSSATSFDGSTDTSFSHDDDDNSDSDSRSSSYLQESIAKDNDNNNNEISNTNKNNVSTKNQKIEKNATKSSAALHALNNNKNVIYDCRPIHLKLCVQYLDAARLNSCAILTHLVKYCPVSNLMCTFKIVIDTLVKVSLEFTSPVHTRCIEILCHLTRFQSNNTFLAQKKELVETLISCGKSKEAEDRLSSLRALQNLTSDSKSKLHLATTSLLTLLSVSAMRKDEQEQLAAVGSLLNLSTESANIVPLTNTKSVLATLIHLAHNPNSSFEVRRMACNTLSNISLWLQTLAGKGTVPEEVDKVLLPSNEASGWQRWE